MASGKNEYAIENINRFRRLAELLCEVPFQTRAENCFALNSEVRFGEMHIFGEKISFKVRVRQAHVQLNLHGCKIASGSRFADVDVPRRKKTKITNKSKTKAKAGADASISHNPALSISGSVQHEVETQSSTAHELPTVQALPDTIWRITEHAPGKYLEGKFLGDDNICTIELTDPQFAVEATLFCFPYDLQIDQIVQKSKGSILSRLSPLKKKCIEIFVSKAIRQKDEEIHLSQSIVKGARDGCQEK